MKMRVRWEIDVEAETALDAAREALAIQRDPESIATYFEVRDAQGQPFAGVDLSAKPGDEVEPTAPDEAGSVETRVFCQYDNPYGQGPVIAFALLAGTDEARWAPWREMVKASGASEAFWADTQTPVFFVYGERDEVDFCAGFSEATGLPEALFDELERRYEDGDFDPLRLYLEDVDADRLFTRLGQAAEAEPGRYVPVRGADGMKVNGHGDVIPLVEDQGDDGRLEVTAAILPGRDEALIDVLSVDRPAPAGGITP